MRRLRAQLVLLAAPVHLLGFCRYGFGAGPKFTRAEWYEDKYKLSLEFPNLPYYLDGDVRMTQSMAILRHLGRKHGLTAPSDQEKLKRRVDMVGMEARDIQRTIGELCYSPDYDDTMRREFLVKNARKMRQLEAFLTKGGGPFVLGDRVTYVDFLVYEVLDVYRLLGPSSFKKDYPRHVEYLSSVAALPGFREYLASPRFSAFPVVNPSGKILLSENSVPSENS